jgi:hypothetical protein
MSDAIDTGAGLSVGDAVLSFLADTTQLDVAFQRIPAQAQAAMDKAAASVNQVGDAADDAGVRLGAAGDSAGVAGEKISEGMEVSRKTTAEARGEAGLLGEAFGIHLPRHVRSFVAELPGIGAALSAAFAATAVLFLIEALATGVEKLEEWAQHAHRMALAWNEFNTQVATSFGGLDDKLLEAGIKMDDLKGNHVDALKKALELIDHVSMHELEQEFGLLAKAADAMFSQLSASWYQFDAGSKGAKNALDDFKAQYDLLLAEGKKNEASDLLAGTLKAAQDTQKALQAAKKEVEDLNQLAAETPGAQPSLNSGPSEKQLQAQEALVKVLQAQVDAEKKINELAKDDSFVKQSEEGLRAATAQEKGAKQALDAQLAAIDTWKSAQHASYAEGKTDLASWLAAEVHATDAAAIAHESYLQKMVAITTRSGNALKIQAAQQELATFQTKSAAEETDKLAAAEQKHVEASRKIVEEYGRLLDANVGKEFEETAKAVEKLTAADDELSKAQSKLAEDKLSQYYKDQESAITKLAAMHLITEEQKDDRLKALEQQQANAAVQILEDQLAKEKAAMDAAQEKVTYGKNNPLTVSPSQLADAEANLAKLATAYTNTESQIIQVQEKFNKESETNDKSHYGRALLEAMGYGKELLAEQMRENHASLIAAEGELQLAKAHGADTAAIEKKIAALKQSEQALEQAANGDTRALAALLKRNQAELAAAKIKLATAQADGKDTSAIKQHITALEADIAAMQKGLSGDKMVLAQKLIQNQADLQQLQFMRQMLVARGQDTKAIDAQIKALQKLDQVLSQAIQKTPNLSKAMVELRESMEQAATTMVNSFSTAMEGVIKGQESFGKAMEKATLGMLGQMAQHWAMYFMGLAIGNMWTDPGAAAEEFAAAAALEMIAGTMSGLASGGSASGGGTQSGAPSPGQTSSSSAGGGTNQTGSVARLAEGGIVSKPTMITSDVMAGDSPSGGAAEEAILPLSDPDVMSRLAQTIIQHMFAGSSDNSSSSPRTVGEALGFHSEKADPSEKLNDDFGIPSAGERPGFDFSQTPLPREMPDMQALAAQFGGLLSASTLRAASNSQSQVAAAASSAAPAVFDEARMEKFAGRLAEARQGTPSDSGSAGDTTHVHVNVKGMVSPDNLNKIVKKINRAVQNRQMTLKASDSLRTTRRSQ